MDSSTSYDAVASLNLPLSPAQPPAPRTEGAGSKFQCGVRAVIAKHRLQSGVFGRKWNDLTPEGRKEILEERRQTRMIEAETRRQREESRVSIDDVLETCSSNVHSNAHRPSRGVLCGVAQNLWARTDDLVNTKAWFLNAEASTPLYSSTTQFPNRKKDTPFVTKAHLLNLGIAYMKLNMLTPTLAQLNEIALERSYTVMKDSVMRPEDPEGLKRWYMEHYNTEESMLYIQEGSCHLDFRDEEGDFIRIQMSAGDLILCPAHRFFRGALDQSQRTRMIRLYQDENCVVYRDLASLDFASKYDIQDYSADLSRIPRQPDGARGWASPRNIIRTLQVPPQRPASPPPKKTTAALNALPPLALPPKFKPRRKPSHTARRTSA